jgi:hypothetical protein
MAQNTRARLTLSPAPAVSVPSVRTPRRCRGRCPDTPARRNGTRKARDSDEWFGPRPTRSTVNGGGHHARSDQLVRQRRLTSEELINPGGRDAQEPACSSSRRSGPRFVCSWTMGGPDDAWMRSRRVRSRDGARVRSQLVGGTEAEAVWLRRHICTQTLAGPASRPGPPDSTAGFTLSPTPARRRPGGLGDPAHTVATPLSNPHATSRPVDR